MLYKVQLQLQCDTVAILTFTTVLHGSSPVTLLSTRAINTVVDAKPPLLLLQMMLNLRFRGSQRRLSGSRDTFRL